MFFTKRKTRYQEGQRHWKKFFLKKKTQKVQKCSKNTQKCIFTLLSSVLKVSKNGNLTKLQHQSWYFIASNDFIGFCKSAQPNEIRIFVAPKVSKSDRWWILKTVHEPGGGLLRICHIRGFRFWSILWHLKTLGFGPISLSPEGNLVYEAVMNIA